MVEMNLKSKMIMFVFMIFFMILYIILFGSKNGAIGITIIIATFMNLGNDLSYKPKTSFFKVLILLLVLGIASFLNNPISIFACVLTFIVVFITTFSSYNLFGTDVYLPFLMCYFMMLCIPISIDELPLRLSSLVFGAVVYVGFNIIINKKKDYKLSNATINKLIEELNHGIDLKLKGEKIYKKDFKTVDGFYSSIYNKFEYKIFPSQKHVSILNIVKAFQYIGWIICDYNLTDNELKYIKKLISDIKSIETEDIYNNIPIETNEMNLVLLNLEIISYEIKNKDLIKEEIIDKNYARNLIKPIIKREFSFRSAKFTFAFKMSVVLTIWEVLTLIFNLPYSKWLYFVSIPLMLPYVNDFAYSAKSRIKGTIVGVGFFALIIIIFHNINITPNTFVLLVLIVCMFGMIYTLENKFLMTIFTTIMSVTISLNYIPIEMAMSLKILWVVLGAIVVAIINLGFLPYSVEKETKNNLKLAYKFNKDSITLIKDKCNGVKNFHKTSLLVISNIIGENIEVTEENKELYLLQKKITDISYFIANYIDINGISVNLKDNILNILDDNGEVDKNLNVKDRIISYSTKYLKDLLEKEEILFKN